MSDRIVLVSACLLGIASNYKGKAHPAWDALFCKLTPATKAAGVVFVPVCPEQLGGLSTPRLPAEFKGRADDVFAGRARVMTIDGGDVSKQFITGAEMVGHIARTLGAVGAILSERSPSCGVHQVYDGNFDGRLVEGAGLATSLLNCLGIPTISHQDLVEAWNRDVGCDCVHFLKRELRW